MRIEGELLSLIQAAFYKRDAALLRFEQQRAITEEADAAWRRLVSVVENIHKIEIGKTHWFDVNTGEIHQLDHVAPPTPPAPPAPTPQPELVKKKKGQK